MWRSKPVNHRWHTFLGQLVEAEVIIDQTVQLVFTFSLFEWAVVILIQNRWAFSCVCQRWIVRIFQDLWNLRHVQVSTKLALRGDIARDCLVCVVRLEPFSRLSVVILPHLRNKVFQNSAGVWLWGRWFFFTRSRGRDVIVDKHHRLSHFSLRVLERDALRSHYSLNTACLLHHRMVKVRLDKWTLCFDMLVSLKIIWKWSVNLQLLSVTALALIELLSQLLNDLVWAHLLFLSSCTQLLLESLEELLILSVATETLLLWLRDQIL